MSTPIVIIETRAGQLDGLYCNTDIRFLVVDRDNDDKPTVTGPFSPTLEEQDLEKFTQHFASRPACYQSRQTPHT